jgi:hypothetical protein
MPQRRAPLLALLLALALVAYPATMPFAMAADMPASMPMSMAGGGGDGQCHHQQQPAHHHHALSTCCAGVCGSCPVISVASGIAPRVRVTAPVFAFQNDLSAVPEQLVLRSLPYSIGPPPVSSVA